MRAGTDYEPSVGSGASSSSRRPRLGGDPLGDPEGGRDELDPSRRSSLENAVFGVLFTLSKENSETRIVYRWVLLKVLLDGWQLFTTVVQPEKQGWDIDGGGRAWSVVNVLNFRWLADLGYGAYVALLYAMVALLAANIALCAWVAWCFKEHKFPVVWPIKVLRLFSSVFFQAFDVASLNLLQVGISCRLTGPAEPKMHLDLFPDFSCSAMPQVVHAIVSGVSLVVFILLALLTNMAEVEVNPTSRRPLALGHSGAEVATFTIKALMTLVDVFFGWRRVAACMYLALALLMAWQYLRWSPHLVQWVNYLKSGVSASIVWCAATLVLLVFGPGVRAEQRAAWSHAMTLALLAGLAPAFGVGALISWVVLRRTAASARKALEESEATGTPLPELLIYDDPRDVEVAARCCRVWAGRRSLDKEAVARAQALIKAGLAQFPSNAFVALVQANFMIEALGVSQSGSRQVQAARKLSPGLVSRFIIFVRQQQATQRAAGSNACGAAGNAMDLLGYVEYQRKQRMVVRLHREALQAMCSFWKALDSHDVSFTALSKALAKIDSSVSEAQAAYRVVLETYGNNPRLVRLYGKFLQTIKNDPWGAEEYFAEADRLEQAKDDNASGPLLPDGTPLSRMDELTTAVLVTSSSGEIQMANKHTHELFGYRKGDLDGKTLAALLAPFCTSRLSECLSSLVARSTSLAVHGGEGAGQAVSATAALLGLHRERMVFPLRANISKASGVGEDSTFIAILEPLRPAAHTARLWVAPSGVVMACDPGFFATFGFTPSEVLGSQLGNILACDTLQGKDPAAGNAKGSSHDGDALDAETGLRLGVEASNALDRLLTRARADVPRAPCLVFHRYLGLLACSAAAKQDDLSEKPLYGVDIRLESAEPLLAMVVDRKCAIKYATNPLASTLCPLGARAPGLAPAMLPPAGGMDTAGGAAVGSGSGGAGRYSLLGPGASLAALYTLQDFLPPPWSDLHAKLLKDASHMPPAGRGAASRWSCRQAGAGPGVGATLELRGAAGQPLFMRVAVSSSAGTSGQDLHVIRMARSSLGAALSERRLRLTLSAEGRVTAISAATPAQLFGFDPHALLGRAVWELVEGIEQVTEAASHGTRTGSATGRMSPGTEAGKGDASARMAALLTGALSYPAGASWRVAVLPPLAGGKVPGKLTGQLAATQGAARAKQAVMQVHRPMDEEAEDDAMNDGDFDDAAAFIDLWPLPAVTGVLELDAAGHVTAVREERTRPAGLLFGLPTQALVGEPLNALVDLPPGRNVADLVTADGVAKKSSMKHRHKAQGVKVGPVHALAGFHADGQALMLNIQVISRPGPGQGTTAIVRIHEAPKMGRRPGASPGVGGGAAAPPATSARAGGRQAHRPIRPRAPQLADTTAAPGFAGKGPKLVLPYKQPGDDPTPMRPPPDNAATATEGLHTSELGTPRRGRSAELLAPCYSSAGSLGGLGSGGGCASDVEHMAGDLPGGTGSARPGTSASPPLPPPPPPPPAVLSLALPLRGAAAAGARAGATAAVAQPAVQRDGTATEPLLSIAELPAEAGGDGDGEDAGAAALDGALSGKEVSEEGSGGGREVGHELAHLTADPVLPFGDSLDKDITALGLAAAGVAARGPDAAGSSRTPKRPQGARARSAGPAKSGPLRPSVGPGSRSNSGASDAESDGTAERPQAQTKDMSRISDWVETKGAYYQNGKSANGDLLTSGADSDAAEEEEEEDGPAASASVPSAAAEPRKWAGLRALATAAPPAVGAAPDGPTAARRAGAAGDADDGASDGGQSAMSGQSGVSSSAGLEYKRGKRFRKLAKMMDGGQAEQVLQRFRHGAWVIMAVLAVTHIVCFALVVRSIQGQQKSMEQLFIAGRSNRHLHRALIAARALDQIYKGKAPPNLYDTGKIQTFADDVIGYATTVKELSNSVITANFHRDVIRAQYYYSSIRVWSGINATTGEDTHENVTLWDMVTRVFNSAKDIYQNHEAWGRQGVNISSTPSGQFLLKSGADVRPAIRRVLDSLLQIAIDQTRQVNNLQLACLVAEGCGVSLLAAACVSYLLRKLAHQRYMLYSTFLTIPAGLTRALCTQITNSLTLEDDDDEEEQDAEDAGADEDVAPAAADAAGKKRATTLGADRDRPGGGPDTDGGGGKSFRKRPSALTSQLSSPLEPSSLAARRRGWLAALLPCLPRRASSVLPWSGGQAASASFAAKGSPTAGSRRSLVRDSHDTARMMLPFLVWSALVFTFYATSVTRLQGVEPLVAIASVTNFNADRALRACFFAQELAAEEYPALLTARRAVLKQTAKLVRDAFYTLQLGDLAWRSLGNETERFPHVSVGMSRNSQVVERLFYQNTDCLRRPPTEPCPGPEYRYYQVSHSGLDTIMQLYLSNLYAMAGDAAVVPPGLNDTRFDFIYNVGLKDLTDGIIRAQLLHFDHVDGVFSGIMLLHILLFILLWVCMFGFLGLLLSPLVKRIRKEKRRIAELMSQLPMELDIEKLVGRALGAGGAAAAAGGAAAGAPGATAGAAGSQELALQSPDTQQAVSSAARAWKSILRQASGAAVAVVREASVSAVRPGGQAVTRRSSGLA